MWQHSQHSFSVWTSSKSGQKKIEAIWGCIKKKKALQESATKCCKMCMLTSKWQGLWFIKHLKTKLTCSKNHSHHVITTQLPLTSSVGGLKPNKWHHALWKEKKRYSTCIKREEKDGCPVVWVKVWIMSWTRFQGLIIILVLNCLLF